MRSRRTVDEWRKAVFGHPNITDKTRVYLLLLADYMRPDRTVCVPRSTIAKSLGKAERRIDDRNKEAKDAGLLDTVVRGQKHVTAVYVGLFPEALSATKSSVLRDVNIQRAEDGLSATPGGRTFSKRASSGYAVDQLPNEAREEETA